MDSPSQTTQGKLPVGGQDHSSSVLDNTHDGVPQEASGERIHTRRGLVLTNGIKNNNGHPTETNIHAVLRSPPLNLDSAKRVPHQQHQDRAADHGDGCGEFPSVASAVGAGTPICIF